MKNPLAYYVVLVADATNDESAYFLLVSTGEIRGPFDVVTSTAAGVSLFLTDHRNEEIDDLPLDAFPPEPLETDAHILAEQFEKLAAADWPYRQFVLIEPSQTYFSNDYFVH